MSAIELALMEGASLERNGFFMVELSRTDAIEEILWWLSLLLRERALKRADA